MNWKYLTENDVKMSSDCVDLQIVFGLQSCKTKKDVLDLLHDVRQHERLQMANKISVSKSKCLTDDEKENFY